MTAPPIGFGIADPLTRPTISGARTPNANTAARLNELLNALQALGVLTNSTTP